MVAWGKSEACVIFYGNMGNEYLNVCLVLGRCFKICLRGNIHVKMKGSAKGIKVPFCIGSFSWFLGGF